MGVIHIDDIEPGMKLAADVKDQAGRVLLTAGHEITERHVRVLRMWGVTEADIDCDDRDSDPAVPASRIDSSKHSEEEANSRFRHADLNHPAVKELYRLYVQRRENPQAAEEDHVN